MQNVFFLLLIISGSLLAQNKYRYIDSIFAVIQTDTNRVYATAPELNSPYTGESFTHNTNLTMHIFRPAGDTLKKRPALICIHGGAFISGNKEHDDMLAFCRNFAGKGYVTATIQYRLGMNFYSVASGERAVYRALQDSRAAVRYLKEYSAELGIDTNNVFMLGSSAGAFMCLHNVFMNKESERPQSSYQISTIPPNTDNGPDLGQLDAIAPNYYHKATPRAIISLWGALRDTVLIEQADTNSKVFLVHGTADNIVPFGYGHPFGYPVIPATYGSSVISKRMNSLEYKHETYFVTGAGHEFYGVSNGMWSPGPNAQWDSILKKTTAFLYNILNPLPTGVKEDGRIILNFKLEQNYPNPFNPTTIINYEIPVSFPNLSAGGQREMSVSLKVYDILGKLVEQLINKEQEPGSYSVVWDASKYPGGIYFYELRAGDFKAVKKMVLLK